MQIYYENTKSGLFSMKSDLSSEYREIFLIKAN